MVHTYYNSMLLKCIGYKNITYKQYGTLCALHALLCDVCDVGMHLRGGKVYTLLRT